MNILKGLNDRQREAVTATDGNIRVTAGAGSGKTRVLAHRYAFLVNEVGISPSNILCMTFTNKAAQEMKKRIATMVSQGNVNDFVCTIHGFCVKFLRKEIYHIGYPTNFAVVDEEDGKDMAKQVITEFNIDKKTTTVDDVLSGISFQKGNSTYIEDLIISRGQNVKTQAADNADDAENGQPVYTGLFKRYIELQMKSFALDYDDLIYFTVYILQTFADVRKHWQEELNYIMVDEAQDCNSHDWQIITAIRGDNHNLFFVGDPDQCIYEWRGARPQLFIDFKPDLDIVLAENYRSTPNILDVANSIISHNRMRIKKDLFTEKQSGKIVVHYHGESEDKEAEWIASQIASMVEAGAQYSDFAILYRASHLSRFIEQALLKKHVQYTVWGGVRFFDRKEIKDALAYLRLLVYRDDISFRRIINIPSRKFGRQSMEKLAEAAEAHGISLFAELETNDDMLRRRELRKFTELIDSADKYRETHSISDTLDYLLRESGYKDELRLDSDQSRIDNLQELTASIKYYEDANRNEENVSIENYLQDIALYTNADYKQDTPTVKLMTIHQAKGLEFPYVFVCGMTEGIFPSHRAIRERREAALEEERRLMYVAVTRAERALFLTESEGYNYNTSTQKYPSRFLQEIGDGLIKVEGNLDPALFLGTKYLIKELDKSLQQNTGARFKKGDTVYSKFFGRGEIIDVNTENNSYKVQFLRGTRDMVEDKLMTKEEHENGGRKDDSSSNDEEKTEQIELHTGQKVFHPKYGIGYIIKIDNEYGRAVIQFRDKTHETSTDDKDLTLFG